MYRISSIHFRCIYMYNRGGYRGGYRQQSSKSSSKSETQYIEQWQQTCIQENEFYETHAQNRTYFYSIDLQGRLFLEEVRIGERRDGREERWERWHMPDGRGEMADSRHTHRQTAKQTDTNTNDAKITHPQLPPSFPPPSPHTPTL